MTEESIEFMRMLQDRRVAEVDRCMPGRYADLEAPVEVAAWTERFLAGGAGNLVLVGPTGVGKTAACWAALRCVVAGGYTERWRFWDAADLAAALRPSETSEATLEEARSAGLLIVDDLAVSALTGWQTVQLTRIVDARWKHERPTIVTSNILKLSEVLDERIASRLQHGATIVTIRGADRRRQP